MTGKEKDRRMRIFWNSNAPWAHSGYSVQTRDLLNRFHDDGWELAIGCFYGLEGSSINYNGITCYPKMGDTYGTDMCIYHAENFKADAVFTFQDVWPMNRGLLPRIKNWVPYVPIDHDPVPPVFVDILKNAHRIITFSRFGHDALSKAGLESTLILEATDIDIFKPMDKIEMRKALGIPEDIFLFGMVAANKDNPPRKGFQHVLDAFKIFHEKHPKSGIFFQTLLQQDGGFPIQEYANYLEIPGAIYFPPPYQMMYQSPHPVIARIVNSFDCLLNPSSSEGFGLPIIEAQSCGVPVIVNNFTSMPELVVPGVTGEICEHEHPRWSPLRAYIANPDVNSLLEKMEIIFSKGREAMSKDCREHIVKNYDINKRVANEWTTFLENLQKELLPKEVKENGTNKEKLAGSSDQ